MMTMTTGPVCTAKSLLGLRVQSTHLPFPRKAEEQKEANTGDHLFGIANAEPSICIVREPEVCYP